MAHYGFELRGGRDVTADAETLAEAIAQAEASTGTRVQRGRLLDGFDNDAAPGIPQYVLMHLSLPVVPSADQEDSWP